MLSKYLWPKNLLIIELLCTRLELVSEDPILVEGLRSGTSDKSLNFLINSRSGANTALHGCSIEQVLRI